MRHKIYVSGQKWTHTYKMFLISFIEFFFPLWGTVSNSGLRFQGEESDERKSRMNKRERINCCDSKKTVDGKRSDVKEEEEAEIAM